jgi:diguanylate cyclase (GGDEF)-like protein
MHLFMICTYYYGVRRMNTMITDSLNLRFENETLVNDLQRLLNAVAQSNKELDQISTTDELTGASNFRAFRVRLEEHRRKHITNKLPLSVVMVNVDYYYEYNDFYGQDMGNRTLTNIAHLLMAEIIRKDEVVARINGAEFGLLLPSVSCESARMMMERVMHLLQEQGIEHAKSRVGPLVTLSVGICCVPVKEDLNARDLIVRAEQALRQAKKNGRNCIEVINT